ncbi:MAG: tetraacyldisaccharide 4'-kinase [Chloroflexota bacterium]
MTDALAREVWEWRGVRGKLLWLLLLPASCLFAIGVQLRNALFKLGWLRSTRLPRPVISVGNLTVGGTGKTPTCLWLSEALGERGLRVGILSRGYRRKEKRSLVLQPRFAASTASESDLDALKSGDEPLMMAQLYDQIVGIGKNRGDAAAEVLRSVNVDVFILDDGFQHRRVKRDVDIVLLGSDCSGWTLPAGPFREPRRNLQRADFFLTTGSYEEWQKVIPKDRAGAAFAGAVRAVCLIGIGGRQVKEFPLSILYRSKILTVTGVGDPTGLYRLIHEWEGEIVETLEFPDHHFYTTADWQQISRVARLVDLIVTTEKDIVKLRRFPFAKDRLLALRVAMSVQNGAALIDAIVAKLRPCEGGMI